MTRVSYEQSLAPERGIEAGQHLVEGVRQPAQLVVRTTQVDALVERVGRQLLGGMGDLGNRAKGLLRQQITAQRTDDND